MVLATHLVVGGALGQVISSPALALSAGFISHFLLDSIPHWDYKLASLEGDRDGLEKDIRVYSLNFVFDLVKIGLDFLIGLISLWLIWQFLGWEISNTVIWGAIGGVLPDFLQFAYVKLRAWPLTQLQPFHMWIHTKIRLDGRWVIGPFLQAIVALAVITLAGGLL